MATITVRGVDNAIKAALAEQARKQGRSMEAEARLALAAAVGHDRASSGLGSIIHDRFAEIGGVDLRIPARSEGYVAVEFDG